MKNKNFPFTGVLMGVTTTALIFGGDAQAFTTKFYLGNTPTDEYGNYIPDQIDWSNKEKEDYFEYYRDGISLTAKGSTKDGQEQRKVFRNHNGLGVYGGWGDSKQLDGSGPDEKLTFHFDHEVRIISAQFANIDWNDDFSWSVEGSDYQYADPGHSGWPTYNFVDNGHDLMGKTFHFSVRDKWDDYQIKHITVEKVPVPEPLTILGTGVALGFGGLFKRKYSTSSK